MNPKPNGYRPRGTFHIKGPSNYRRNLDPVRTRNIQLFRSAVSQSGNYQPPIFKNGPIYQKTGQSDLYQPFGPDCPKIQVISENCLTSIRRASQELAGQRRCAVLNMANYSTPGGGVTHGSRAQEEFLCRVSNLYPALKKAQLQGHYPLISGFRHEGVTFFRDEDYKDVSAESGLIFQADVITISALHLKGDSARTGRLTLDEQSTIRKRIQQLLDLCVGYDWVVLSAFGCGAFRNPPEFVAECFRRLLMDSPAYQGKIGRVDFAIIEDHNSQNNYDVFKKILEPN